MGSGTDPFGLPPGSMRALITLILVGISGCLLFFDTADNTEDIRAMFVLLTGVAVRDYFAYRSEAGSGDNTVVGGSR